MSWLPVGFVHPASVEVMDGYHLRPIRAADVDLDYPAVMGSQARLWSIFGEAWGWPTPTMTHEQDREDLARHEEEIEAHQSFNYALLNKDETALFGCVYIDPPEKVGADVEISWWVVDGSVGSELERLLDSLVPRWIAADWPFERPRHRPGPELARLAGAAQPPRPCLTSGPLPPRLSTADGGMPVEYRRMAGPSLTSSRRSISAVS